jgi:hypothetical protein
VVDFPWWSACQAEGAVWQCFVLLMLWLFLCGGSYEGPLQGAADGLISECTLNFGVCPSP